MQIDYKILRNEWVPLSDFIVIEDDVTYRIQNRGSDCLLALEAANLPDNDATDGVLIPPFAVIHFKLGAQDLYLRAYSSVCEVNVYSES